MNWKINNLPDFVMEWRKRQLRFLSNRDKSGGKIKDGFILEDYAVVVSLTKKSAMGQKRALQGPGKTHRTVLKGLECVRLQRHWEHGHESTSWGQVNFFYSCLYLSWFTFFFLLYYMFILYSLSFFLQRFWIYTLKRWAV